MIGCSFFVCAPHQGHSHPASLWGGGTSSNESAAADFGSTSWKHPLFEEKNLSGLTWLMAQQVTSNLTDYPYAHWSSSMLGTPLSRLDGAATVNAARR